MKKYQNNFKTEIYSFFRLSTLLKIKKILKISGIKFVIYQILYFFLSLVVKSKSYFLKGIFFDALKNQSELLITKNRYNEKFILFSSDSIISKEMYVKEEFDLKKLEKTLNFLKVKKNKNIENLYDIGANIGVICIPAVNRGLVKRAYAVEPESQNFQLLKTNIVLNNLEEKISSYNYALSDKDDEIVDMELAKNSSGDHRIRKFTKFNIHGEEKREIVKVKTKKFDSLFNNLNQKNDLVWIDTQGYEPIILSGSKKLIDNKVPIVIEFWPYGLKRSDLWEKMFETLNNFNYFIDLSSESFAENKINDSSLNNLKNGWDQEKKGSPSLFTDLLLLRE